MTRAALALLLVATPVLAQRQPGWEVRAPERVDVIAGTNGAIAISIAVDRGLTVSRDASVIVDLVAPPGVIIRKKRLGRHDAVDPEADAPRFAATVRGETVGTHTVGIRVRFWVCGGKACRPVDVRRSAQLAVSEAPQVPVMPPEAKTPPKPQSP